MSGFSDEEKKILHHIILEIDDDGYLQMEVSELSQKHQWPLAQVEEALLKLQELDPAGSGG